MDDSAYRECCEKANTLRDLITDLLLDNRLTVVFDSENTEHFDFYESINGAFDYDDPIWSTPYVESAEAFIQGFYYSG